MGCGGGGGVVVVVVDVCITITVVEAGVVVGGGLPVACAMIRPLGEPIEVGGRVAVDVTGLSKLTG